MHFQHSPTHQASLYIGGSESEQTFGQLRAVLVSKKSILLIRYVYLHVVCMYVIPRNASTVPHIILLSSGLTSTF